MVGLSIVRQAFLAVRRRPEGSNIGLHPHKIWWKGYSGLTLRETKKKLQILLKIGENPDFIMLHVGCNDLGARTLVTLRYIIDDIFQFILLVSLKQR